MYKKFDGSYALSNRDLQSLIPNPILSGFGIIDVSSPLVAPAPNCISNFLLDLNLVTNLLVTFLVLSKNGTWLLYCLNSGSLASIFGTSSNTVSWAK